ncbi:hypothetical protein KEM55_006175 [Ascosphaera atra]|nr:hypothetical protein KEM55_006175 [Ascosphaera atra]
MTTTRPPAPSGLNQSSNMPPYDIPPAHGAVPLAPSTHPGTPPTHPMSSQHPQFAAPPQFNPYIHHDPTAAAAAAAVADPMGMPQQHPGAGAAPGPGPGPGPPQAQAPGTAPGPGQVPVPMYTNVMTPGSNEEGYNGQDDGNDAKRRRIARACDMCRKKKIKCDGKMPKCSHCINYKTECIFTQVEKKRNPPKGYVVKTPFIPLLTLSS